MWDYDRQKVWYVAAPAFDEEVGPGWWRGPVAATEEEDEPRVLKNTHCTAMSIVRMAMCLSDHRHVTRIVH